MTKSIFTSCPYWSWGFPGSSASKESTCNAGAPSSIPGLRSSSFGEGIGYPLQYSWASLVTQMVKNLPTIWETWVQSLGWQDPLEQSMATHSSILAREIPWTEEPGGLWGHREWDRTERLSIHTWILGRPCTSAAALLRASQLPSCPEAFLSCLSSRLCFWIPGWSHVFLSIPGCQQRWAIILNGRLGDYSWGL